MDHGDNVSVAISWVVDPLQDPEDFHCTGRERHTCPTHNTAAATLLTFQQGLVAATPQDVQL